MRVLHPGPAGARLTTPETRGKKCAEPDQSLLGGRRFHEHPSSSCRGNLGAIAARPASPSVRAGALRDRACFSERLHTRHCHRPWSGNVARTLEASATAPRDSRDIVEVSGCMRVAPLTLGSHVRSLYSVRLPPHRVQFPGALAPGNWTHLLRSGRRQRGCGGASATPTLRNSALNARPDNKRL